MSESLNIELRYGGEKHRRIFQALEARRHLSETRMRDLFEDFRDAENQYRAYIPETDADAIRKDKRDEDGVPQYTTLQIPYSYAVLLSAHTYWTSVFLGRQPVMQFTGRHGEPQMAVQAVEALMDYQLQVGQQLARHYIWMHDTPKYGIGVLCTYWANESVQTSRIIEEPVTVFGLEVPGKTKRRKETIRIPGYEGNKVFNVSPYKFLPDPRVPITDTQDGEFVGRKLEMGWNALVRGKDQGRFFNLEAVKRMTAARRLQDEDASDQLERIDSEASVETADVKDVGTLTGYEMFVDLIPRDWQLGSSESPEKWVFTVLEDVIIEARPQGDWHGKFPYHVLPYEVDGHSFVNRSMMTVLKPLNDTMTWLINTHFFNVRASLNNQFIVDPFRVVMKDLTSGGAGKIIRLKETAYGSDVRSVIQQLPVQDITQNHLRDSQMISEMVQRVSGVTDNIMGMVNAGGRKTATEIRTSSTFGANRLKTTAEYWSAVAFSPMAQLHLQNTQQYYDLEKKFKIAGRLWEDGKQYLEVTPDMITGEFDFVPVDGTMPIDRYAQSNLWREILMGLGKMPQIAMQYNMGGIFEWMAQLAGMKNIKQFKVQVQPDQMLAAQLQAGNVVPMGGQGGQRSSGNLSGPPEPGQISGMGATG